jgi:signal transduction histidine kinase
VQAVIAPCLAGTQSEFSVEFRAIQRNGSVRWLLTRGKVVLDPSGGLTRMLGSTIDVTELKLAQLQLREAKEAAERANQAKSDFLSRMSHELRTPLNAILGFAQLLESDLGSEAHRQDAVMILKAGRHLLDLINEVLDITRIEAGRIDLAFQSMDVGHLLEEVLDLVRPFAQRNGVHLESARTSGDDRKIWADAQRLRQVLLNLLTNAVKYNRIDGTVTLDGTAIENGRYRISVTDDGPGLPPELLDRLFTPFDRLGAETTRVEGVGLGLALSKRLVEAMGGELGVESRPGLGSTFYVELPVANLSMNFADVPTR